MLRTSGYVARSHALDQLFSTHSYSLNNLRRCFSYFRHESDKFINRHIGPEEHEKLEMVRTVGFQSLDQLIAATVPASIRSSKPLSLSKPLTEFELIGKLQSIANKNDSEWRSFIGMGYYQCYTPPVIMRNILENTGIQFHACNHSLYV